MLLPFPAHVALGNPVGEKVVAGSAAFQRSANALTINQSSDRAIINWQGFSIGVFELTRFVQPSALSATLNRVVSGNPSALLGRLEANGRIFLINPNGILLGGGAVINTNSLVASTLDVLDSQFLAGGNLNFVGRSKAGIQNLGTIHAEGGDVFLIAHTVDNAGAIEASKGTVGLAAGNDVLLKHAGDERLFVQATLGGGAITETGVNNAGLVSAVQAELRGAGGNVYALAVNNTGAVHAAGITEKDGRILLTSAGGNIQNSGSLTARSANGDGGTVTLAGGHASAAVAAVTSSGMIDASGKSPGSKGGSVAITGDYVGLTGNALVDVSGHAGGGTVLLGGDYHGSNPAIQNADVTLVNKDARINADAIASGDGGKVIVWANHGTEFDGYISARGGANGGNGGFVETSGKVLQVGSGAQVDAGASNGAPGLWLLDPFNVEIVNFATTNGSFSGGNPNLFTPTGNDSTVNAGTINLALTSGTSVTVRTTGAGIQPGNITVTDPISVDIAQNSATPVPTLDLEANNQIIINAPIGGATIFSKGLNLTANANGAINVSAQAQLFNIRNGAFTSGKKDPTLASSGGITMNGSIISFINNPSDRFTMQAAGDITGAGTLGAVNVDLNSSAGSVNFSGRLTANLLTAAVPAGSITINNANGVNVNFLGGISSGGAINIKNTGNGASALNVVGAVVAGGVSPGSPLSITTAGTLFIDGAGIFGKGTGSLTDATGTVTLNARDVSNAINPVAPPITAAGLAISAQQGIGTGSGQPLQTSVSSLEAQTAVGGIFIKNTGRDLTLGIPSFAVGGVGGVLVTDLTNGDQIQIVNDRTIALNIAGGENAHVAAPGNILVQANGTTADVVIASNSPNAVTANGGSVTLNAGRDVVVGASGRRGDVTGSTISLNAGHAVVVDEGSRVTGAAGGINATAGTIVPSTDGRPSSIVFFQTAVSGAHFETSNGGPINLTTAPGGFIDLHSGGNSSSIRTTLTPGQPGTITFKTDDVNLANQIDAGVGGTVIFNNATPGKPIDLGTDHPASIPNFPQPVGTTALSLTNAELGLVTAGSVAIGDAASRTDVRVTAPINVTTFGSLILQALGTGGGDNMIAASVTVPFFEIQATNAINSQGAIKAINRLTLTSDNGNIVLSGPVQTNFLVVPGAGQVSLESLSNQISALNIQRRGDVTIRNTIPLLIGSIAGTNTQNNVTIRTVGDITLGGGAHVVSSGQGHEIVLEAGNGHFINNAGPDAGGPPALDAQSGARFRVYSVDNSSPYEKGGLPGTEDISSAVSFSGDPLAPAPVFYFASLGTTGTSSGDGTSSGGGSNSAQNSVAAFGAAIVEFNKLLGSSGEQILDVIIQGPRFYRAPLATLTVTPAAPIIDHLSRQEHDAEDNGAELARQDWGGGELAVNLINYYGNGEMPVQVAAGHAHFLSTLENNTTQPWRLLSVDVARMNEMSPDRVLVRADADDTVYGVRVLWNARTGPERVPPGGTVRTVDTQEGRVLGIYDRNGNLIDSGSGNIVTIGSGNEIVAALALKTVAASRLEVEKAEEFAGGSSVVLSNGQRVIVPGGAFGPPPPPAAMVLSSSLLVNYLVNGGLGARLSESQITNIANIISEGGNGLTRLDVAHIVAAGGGNFTPGVITALVASGGGNLTPLTPDAISRLVATGGGNISNPTAMMSIITAGLVASGAGNLVGNSGGTLVATGGGNVSMISNLVAAGGGNISRADVATIIAAGASVVSHDGASVISNDGASVVSHDGASVVSHDGASVVSHDGASVISNDGASLLTIAAGLVAAGGGNLVATGGGNLVATGGGNISAIQAAQIVATGGGNFYNAFNNLVASGAGNLVGNRSGTVISNDGASIISERGNGLVPSLSQGTSLINSNSAPSLLSR